MVRWCGWLTDQIIWKACWKSFTREFGELFAMMDGITEKLLWYAESLASELQTLVRHSPTFQDNPRSYLMANFGLTMFSAQATRKLSRNVVTVLGAKLTVDTRKMQYFVARDPV